VHTGTLPENYLGEYNKQTLKKHTKTMLLICGPAEGKNTDKIQNTGLQDKLDTTCK
jgi:hypothetical protein